MQITTFQDFLVWKKAHELVLLIYQITKTFPSDERFGLISQVKRSASSICANIAEGYMKSRNDFLRYLSVSRGSLEETKYHLILSRDLGYLSVDDFNKLFNLSEEVGKLLHCLIKRL